MSVNTPHFLSHQFLVESEPSTDPTICHRETGALGIMGAAILLGGVLVVGVLGGRFGRWVSSAALVIPRSYTHGFSLYVPQIFAGISPFHPILIADFEDVLNSPVFWFCSSYFGRSSLDWELTGGPDRVTDAFLGGKSAQQDDNSGMSSKHGTWVLRNISKTGNMVPFDIGGKECAK